MGKPKIFLSYVQEDREKVKKLSRKLSNVGFTPWMDKHGILPGEDWALSIHRAMRNSDFVLVCLSPNSVAKRSFFQTEIRKALDFLREKLDSDIYLIPVQIDKCEVPESLQNLRLQSAKLFENDGFAHLVKAIREGMKRQSKQVAEAQINTNVRIEKSKTRPAMQKSSHKKLLVKRRSAGNALTKIAVNSREIANPNIWIKEHKMWVEVRPDKRIVKHEYLLKAFKKDADLYRFKLRWTGSGDVTVIKEPNGKPLDDELTFFGVSDIEWQHRAVAFSQRLRKGETKSIILTFESMDAEQIAKSLQGVSYTDVAGCDKLSMYLQFFDLSVPDGIKLIRCDHHWNDIIPEEIYIKHKEIDEHTREYSFEIKPERDVKYMVKWQPPLTK